MAIEGVTVRTWRRGDDRRMRRWETPPIPAHWITPATPPGGGQRENWAIELEGQLVGRISLYDFNRHPLYQPSARLGIHLRPDSYGRGVGTAALAAFFAVCPVVYLRLDVASDNRRALRCYRRAGFRELALIWGCHQVAYVEMERHLASHSTVHHNAVHSAAD